MSHAVRAGRQCRGREHDDLRRTAAETSVAGTLDDLVTAPADPARVAAALADAARLGGYATVVPDVAGAPVSRVYADGPELGRRTAQVRAALHCDERVAASLAQQGFAASLVTPPIAAAVVHGVLPLLGPDELHWRETTSGPWRQSCAGPRGRLVTGQDDAVAALAGALVDPHLHPLVAAVRARASVSPTVLWGNAASAVAAAGRLVAAEWPEHADRAAAVVRGLLASGPFAGTGEFRGRAYRRRSCCLFHRAPGGGLCGDCVLQPRA